MTEADSTSFSRGFRQWAFSLALFLAGVAFISLFWGSLPELLPEPLDRWGRFFQPTIRSWWSDWPMLWLAAHVGVGLVIPGIVLWLCGRKPTDVGLGLPNALGRRLILVSAVTAVPFGFWLMATRPEGPSPGGVGLLDLHYVCSLLAIIPEHFLICGTYVAIMLPARRLPCPVTIAPVRGRFVLKVLRWLGLAQPQNSGGSIRPLAWFGLTGPSLLAILLSGALFAMVHIGKGHPLELMLSFPGGVGAAYITLRSHSIWPAILAHWALNLVPETMMMLR